RCSSFFFCLSFSLLLGPFQFGPGIFTLPASAFSTTLISSFPRPSYFMVMLGALPSPASVPLNRWWWCQGLGLSLRQSRRLRLRLNLLALRVGPSYRRRRTIDKSISNQGQSE